MPAYWGLIATERLRGTAGMHAVWARRKWCPMLISVSKLYGTPERLSALP